MGEPVPATSPRALQIWYTCRQTGIHSHHFRGPQESSMPPGPGKDKDRKPKLAYPCVWTYTVIGFDEFELRLAIEQIVVNREYNVQLSRRSARGTYCSMNLEVLVFDDADRVALYEALSAHAATKIVL
jgi:putative lipoic acid-binding regulatory protein